MNARFAALACAGLWTLAACTGASPAGSSPIGAGTPTATVAPTTTTNAPPSSTPATTPSDSPPAASTGTPNGPAVIVLSGTEIGGQALGHAPVSRVDPLVVARLGRAKTGQPLLCASDGDRSQLAVIDHHWPGLTVRYGSGGAAAVAIGWSVDLAHIPDGFRLAGGLEWRPPFAVLTRLAGVSVSTRGGTQLATLSGKAITWSGPVGASRPDVVSGGPILACD